MDVEQGAPSVSVVVPVYDGAAALSELVRRVATALTPAVAGSWEIILVNDASRDESWSLIEKLATENPGRVRGIDLARNVGQHAALLAGIRSAREKITVTMDDDLQHRPEEIPALLSALEKSHNVDVVYGLPATDRHDLFRRFAAWAAKALLERALGARGVSLTSSFRAFRTSLRSAFAAYEGPDVDIDALLSWGAARFAVVPIEHQPREHGRSTYTLRKLLRHTRSLLTGFSVLPLRLASYLGFLLTGFGLLVLADVVGVYFLQGGSVPGFPFLASIVAIFSGAQLFALGIIGEYLACIHFRAMHRPTHVVRRETP
ncbi:MAG: glycosyltransferase family 2 protein [Thermoanaerobaculia bacterium]